MLRLDDANKTKNAMDAKRIVREGLDRWMGTHREFQKFTEAMGSASKGIISVEKRETFVAGYLRKVKPLLYVKRVEFGLSNNYAIEVHTQGDAGLDVYSSKAQKKKSDELKQKLNQYNYKLNTKTTFVFVVTDDSKAKVNELILMIFSPIGACKSELFRSHAVAVVKKHCLERLVERLNLNSVEEAMNEILSATKWIEGSGKELAARPPGSYGDEGIKRHVPTPNGALLLLTAEVSMRGTMPEQDCALITWIHKRQFKKNQAVTNREFKFAMTVNEYISDPNLSEYTAGLRNVLAQSPDSSEGQTVFVHLHGERYPAAEFLLALERREFLDFTIDFERDISNL
jgi:hypothetical protein